MKLQLIRPAWFALVGFMLTVPTAFFLFINILKFELGYDALYDAVAPTFDALGLTQPLGFNISLLILFGPALAIVLNLPSILSIGWSRREDVTELDVQFYHRPVINWIVIAVSSICLIILFGYGLAENCNC